MNQAPTHWTQFDKLYNLPDPRPYFRGVETGDYRMPGVMAGALCHLIPVLGETGHSPVRLVDFAAGYGAVGMCLRAGRTMADLFSYFGRDGTPDADAERFAEWRSLISLEPHRIDAVDIAERALDYALACGAIDAGHTDDLMAGPPGRALKQVLTQADLIYECGAIGDHVATAMAAVLRAADPNRPVLLLSPRPRVDLAPLRATLAEQGYEMRTAIGGIRYRRPFSPKEMDEEISAGIRNGYSPEECTVGDYFRVDLRVALPSERDPTPLLQALAGLSENLT